MDSTLLNTENQEFITKNLDVEISKILFKRVPETLANVKLLVEQIEAKKRCTKKLPTWYNEENIYYPNKLNIEQTSSEITAKYKSSLVSGKSLIDLTGGFGVDSYYFSKQIENVVHCEIDESLSHIVKHNYEQLNVNNIKCLAINGIDILKQTKSSYDWIYLDPSRRDGVKGKVFLLKDCIPNAPKFASLFLNRSKNVIIKTSPLLDISSGLLELTHVKAIHIVAVNNEVKELLWILERDYVGEVTIKTVNLKKQSTDRFNFLLDEEKQTLLNLDKPLNYLYEPNAAILKSGAFNLIAEKFNLFKLHKHSHLYTNSNLVDFPGRKFKIEDYFVYNKKTFKKKTNLTKANITIRNFPETVKNLRKKLSIKDGGDYYLFFTTNLNNQKIVLVTKKVI